MTDATNSEPSIQQLFDLTGRVALVTGGAGYLGTAISTALAEAGAAVVLSSRDIDRAASAASALPRPGDAQHHGIKLDHKDDESIRAGLTEAIRLAGKVDVLVNNGHGGPIDDWTNISAEGFADHLSNATGYFLLARLMREHVIERGESASIIMLGSMYGMVASYPEAYEDVCPASSVGYHALKGGIIHMTRHLAIYWAKDQVRVNCLSPGPFPPERVTRDLVDRLCQKSPMGRMGQAHEVKGAALFLASDASSYVTGQNIVVDGGWTAW